VLLVDDHRQVLVTVSAMLSADFEIVGEATDGARAVETAHQVQPDAIVLDVNMPGLDGFQTCRALASSGLAATPVVFLSMHDADEVVGEAFRCGGRGYVLKTRVDSDLASALDHVLGGRVFVPSLSSLLQLATGNAHAMQVHSDAESCVDDLAQFFDLALRRGDATCVIATEEIREGLGDRLRARGWDIGGPGGHKRYQAIDARDALRRFMRDGLPDPDRLAEIAVELDQYRRAVCDGPASRLTVFGNMVMVLHADGNTRAMIALEHHWNRLTRQLPILTLCAYGSSCFHGAPGLWPDVCAEHWAVSHARNV
jgi:DNA-binding NarL/FixJ family response regulator